MRTTRRPRAWTLTGFLAASLIVAAHFADAPGLLEARASWWRPLIQLPAHLLLLLSWWRLGPGCRRPLLVAAIWAVPFLLSLPLHSRDVYSYAAQGWLMTQGLSPYEVPSGMAGDLGLLVGTHWYDTTSVYPSLSLLVFGLVVGVVGEHPLAVVLGMRLPNLLAFAVLAWAVARIARHVGVDRRYAWWLGVANPFLIVQWVGGVHNDALFVALVAVALAIVLRPGAWPLVAGGVVLGLAVGIKQSAALAGLGLVAVAWQSRLAAGRRGWWRLVGTAALPGAVTILTFHALARLSGLGHGWMNDSAGSPVGASSNAPLSWVASFGRFHEIAPPATVDSFVSAFSYVLIVAVLVTLTVLVGPRGDAPGRPWLYLCLALLSFGVFGPAMQPWYLTWVIPFVAFAKLDGWLRDGWWVLLAGFTALAGLQDFLPPYVAMGVVAVPLAIGLWWHRRRAG